MKSVFENLARQMLKYQMHSYAQRSIYFRMKEIISGIYDDWQKHTHKIRWQECNLECYPKSKVSDSFLHTSLKEYKNSLE